jgi:hypothetical protein
MHDRRARLAAESLEKVLAYVPGNKRPGAPVGSRLVRVGAQGAGRDVIRDSHEEDTDEAAIKEAQRIAEARDDGHVKEHGFHAILALFLLL